VRSATCRYLSYSKADFEVFRPAGATRSSDGVKFGMDEGTEVMPNFICDFLLVINRNLPRILHRFRDIVFDRFKIAIFFYTSWV